MSQQRAVYQWMDTVARQIPQVCRSQAKVWAAFSWGVAVARRCSQRGVAEALPTLGKPDTVERRLQRFVANPRLDWRVGAQGLTAWILRRLHSPGPLVLLVDETSPPSPSQGHGRQSSVSGARSAAGVVVLSPNGVADGPSGLD